MFFHIEGDIFLYLQQKLYVFGTIFAVMSLIVIQEHLMHFLKTFLSFFSLYKQRENLNMIY